MDIWDKMPYKIQGLFEDSRSGSAEFKKFNVVYYMREYSDPDVTLSDYLEHVNSEDSEDNKKNILQKIIQTAIPFIKKPPEETEQTTIDGQKIQKDLFNGAVKLLSEEIHEDTIHYIFRTDSKFTTETKEEQPDLVGTPHETNYVGDKYEDYSNNYQSEFWTNSRLVITDRRVLLFILNSELQEIDEDTEWSLAIEIPFEDIEELIYYSERSEALTITTKDCVYWSSFHSTEPSDEYEDAVNYIGGKSGLHQQIHPKPELDFDTFHNLKQDIFSRKNDVKNGEFRCNKNMG